MFAGFFGVIAYDQFVGFATAGTLAGTNQQTVFDKLPTFALVLAVTAVGVFTIGAFLRLVMHRR